MSAGGSASVGEVGELWAWISLPIGVHIEPTPPRPAHVQEGGETHQVVHVVLHTLGAAVRVIAHFGYHPVLLFPLVYHPTRIEMFALVLLYRVGNTADKAIGVISFAFYVPKYRVLNCRIAHNRPGSLRAGGCLGHLPYALWCGMAGK